MTRHISTVITAAGDSRALFRSAGFGRPRSLMTWAGSEVLLHAVLNYSLDVAQTHIALNDDECLEWNTAETVLKKFPEVRITTVRSGVKGALVSAISAMESVPDDHALVVAAGDSMIEGGIEPMIHEFMATGVAAGTIVFRSSNPRWSYVLPGPDRTIRQVAEKRVIGPLATTGVFYFEQALIFKRAAEWCFVNNAHYRELFYVSTTLNYLVAESLQVGYFEIPRSRYRSWSLPADFAEQSE